LTFTLKLLSHDVKKLAIHLITVWVIRIDTIFTRSDAAATSYFIMQFCAACIRERLLFESGIY